MIRNTNDMDLTDGQEAPDPIERAKAAIECYQYDLATALAKIAEAEATQRQADALERIATLLENVTNNEMLSVAFWEQV